MPPAGIEPAPLARKAGALPESYGGEEGSGLGARARAERPGATNATAGPLPSSATAIRLSENDSCCGRDERGWGRPDSNRVGARRRGYGPPRSPYRQRPLVLHCNGAASGTRTRVLDMASRDPSAGRWPRTHVSPPVGIEPTTSGVRNRRCFQLSYGGNGTPPRSRTSPQELWRLPLARPARCVLL